MKTTKIFLIVILGLIIFTSCEKDEPASPTPDLILGLEMDQRLTAAADSLALQMGEGWVEEEVNVYDPVTGEPIIDPLTGEPLTETVQILVTSERQYGIIANMALIENWILCDEVVEYKKANKKRTLFGFPEENLTKIISRQTEDGDIYVEKLTGLNDLSAVADNGLTIGQMIESIFTDAEATAVKASIEYCRERIIYYQGGSKSATIPSDQEIQELIMKLKKSQVQ